MNRSLAPLLYTYIWIPPDRRDNVQALMRTLHANPELASLTASFNGFLLPLPYAPAPEPSRLSRITTSFFTLLTGHTNEAKDIPMDETTYGSVLRGAACNMVSLRALTIPYLEHSKWNYMITDIFAPAVRLRSLEVGLVEHELPRYPYTVLLDVELGKLLSALSTLEHLTIPPHHAISPAPIEPSHIPRLTTMQCGSDAARVLVPGRPVTSLRLTDIPPTTYMSGLWYNVAASTGPMKELVLQVYGYASFIVPHLEYISTSQLALERLELEGVYDNDVDIVSLERFTCLTLTINPIHLSFQLCAHASVFEKLRFLTLNLFVPVDDTTEGNLRCNVIAVACPKVHVVINRHRLLP